MTSLPLDLENIITDYKTDLETQNDYSVFVIYGNTYQLDKKYNEPEDMVYPITTIIAKTNCNKRELCMTYMRQTIDYYMKNPFYKLDYKDLISDLKIITTPIKINNKNKLDKIINFKFFTTYYDIRDLNNDYLSIINGDLEQMNIETENVLKIN